MGDLDETNHNCPICLGFGYVSISNGNYTYDNPEDICQSCNGSGLFSNWAIENQQF
jgi:excinuclease UvrABC ATPase subunit